MIRARRSDPVKTETRHGASKGQIVILFAFFSVSMLGMLGLAMDLGYAFAQKRTVQNAADAAALAGARQVAKWSPTNLMPDVVGEARKYAEDPSNTLASTNQDMVECELVNYNVASDGSGGTVGPCGVGVPPAATGVRVKVRETHSTFFIQIVPGAPDSVTTEALAVAHVQTLADIPSDGPFIVCGSNAWAVADASGAEIRPGQSVSILNPDDSINPIYVGYTFRIYDNKISQGSPVSKKAGCGTEEHDAAWNGRADQDANGSIDAPGRFKYKDGTGVGHVVTPIGGVNGCEAGASQDCVMFLPIGKNDPPPSQETNEMSVVGYAAFRVTRVDTNSMNGTLLDNFVTVGRGENVWDRDAAFQMVVIRLTT